MPGLEILTRYDRSWLRSDLGAGLSVAAIALPVGIAYADLAGVPAVFSMYSAIFPLLAYALFGSSRQLMTGYAATETFAGTLGMSEGVKGCKMPAPSRRPVRYHANSMGRRLTSLEGGNRGR